MVNKKSSSRLGLSLIEILVVIGIIGILAALTLPAVQSVRSGARRAACQNNLRQIGLALLSHESAFQSFPTNDGRPKQTANGASWIVDVLPWVQQKTIFDSLEFEQTCFSDQKLPNRNAGVVGGVVVELFACPSCPLMRMRSQTPHESADHEAYEVQISDYVGNCGYYYSPINGDTPDDRSDSRLNVWNGFGWLQNAGIITTDNQVYNPVKVAQVTDGLSHTIAIGENSNWMTDLRNSEKLDTRSGRVDGGMWAGGEGWVESIQQVEPVTIGTGGYTSNITAIRFPINSPRFYDRTGYTQFAPYALHTGYRSAHPGGAGFAFADGSVHFIGDYVELRSVMMALSGRNDSWTGVWDY